MDPFCPKTVAPVAFLEVLGKLVGPAGQRAAPAPHTVLHVDDHEAHRYPVSRLLRRAGFNVQEAACGAEALEQVLKFPDLVLLDVHLPDIDGFEVCRRLREDGDFVPVIFLTARDAEDDRDCGQRGAQLPPEQTLEGDADHRTDATGGRPGA